MRDVRGRSSCRMAVVVSLTRRDPLGFSGVDRPQQDLGVGQSRGVVEQPGRQRDDSGATAPRARRAN